MEGDDIEVQVCKTPPTSLLSPENRSSENTIMNSISSVNVICDDIEGKQAIMDEKQEEGVKLDEEQHQQQESEQLQEISNRENIDLSMLQNEKSNRIRTNSTSNNNENTNNKFQFRTPQQYLQHRKPSWKKSWKKQSKSRQKNNYHNNYQHQHAYHHDQRSNNDNTNENCQQNLKNHNNHHHYHHNHNNHNHNHHRKLQQQQQQQKNNSKQQQSHNNENIKKTLSKRMTQSQSAAAFSSIRSKFFLPQKRPRKEIIVPPTKFLLGGNISDPLNLNSLQDETTPNATPKQSPITTPPKVEVIIPPNIHDPLHLLDPVDSTEYEKQLISPMKRKSKSKHRHRKKRPRHSSSSGNQPSLSGDDGGGGGVSGETVAGATATSSPNTSIVSSEDHEAVSGHEQTGDRSLDLSATSLSDAENLSKTKTEGDSNKGAQVKSDEQSEHKVSSTGGNGGVKKENDESGCKRDKVCRDLRLNLALAHAHQQQQQQQNQLHSANGSNGSGRKRKSSEGPNSNKNKCRRLDSMDKIVSPVVPQPGAWKRPPRTIPSGGRKNARVRSISASESELISPTEETKTIESESICSDTLDIENNKQFGDNLPSSTISSSHHVQSENEDTRNQHQQKESQQQEQEGKQQQQQQITSSTEENVPKKFKPDGAKYQYGNYDNYLEYRSCNLTEFIDVRLQVFKRHPELFRGKDILDIGCNTGHITIAVAQKLAPKSILGIDIDSHLIAKARKNLSLYVRIPKDYDENHGSHHHHHHQKEKKEKNDHRKDVGKYQSSSSAAAKKKKNKFKKKTVHFHHSKSKFEVSRNEFFPISFPICCGPIPDLSSLQQSNTSPGSGGGGGEKNSNSNTKDDAPSTSAITTTPTPTKTTRTKSKHFKNEFPKNVFFRVTNYVLPDEALLNNDTQQYDLILCLSVTKWIHLNFGDAGLKLTFKRIFNQLRPGGKLILEAQNWASYKKKKNLTEKIYNNYKNIEFFPDDFHEYLLSNEVGFSHAYTLDVPRHKSKGFCRPIQLYAKGDFTPSHIRWSDNYRPQMTPYEAYRGIYAAVPKAPQHPPWNYSENSENYSCRQTPMYSTSQYYNPLETDTYLPSYDTEVLNRHYVFASPLYQTVWSPPASLRNSSSHTPLFGSVRDCDIDDAITSGGNNSRHVYPPNDDGNSPHLNGIGGAFNSIREVDPNDENICYNNSNKKHVYALGGGIPFSSSASSSLNFDNNCSSSSSPHPSHTIDQNQSQNSGFDQQQQQQQIATSSVDVVDCNLTTTTAPESSDHHNANHHHFSDSSN